MLESNITAGLVFFLYLLVGAGSVALIDYFARSHKEWIRKGYHLMIAFSMVVLTQVFPNWQGALMTLLGLLLLALVLVQGAYRLNFLQTLAIDRQKGAGEVSRQIGYFALSFGGLIVVFWGILGPQWRFVVVLASLIWGFGDAAAALVGKFFGRHQLKKRIFDRRKTVEGSLANVAASVVISFIILLLAAGISWWTALLIALVLGSASAVIEAAARRGRDTIILPWSMAALAYPLLRIVELLEQWWAG